jgi:siroheme synthase-like protein
VSAYPLMLDGAQLSALVVGGGAVATRKVRALLAAGARVRVVAPQVVDALSSLAEGPGGARLSIELRGYESGDVGDAQLVIAAADRRDVNAVVTADARALGRLVNVADAPDEGNCVTAATHRAGDLTVAVTAAGVPGAAARVRDLVAERVDHRYAEALHMLAVLRRRTIEEDGSAAWRAVAQQLVGEDFCSAVESGVLSERLPSWD